MRHKKHVGPWVLDLVDGSAVSVDVFTSDGTGVTYTDAGRYTFVPWTSVLQVQQAAVVDEPPLSDPVRGKGSDPGLPIAEVDDDEDTDAEEDGAAGDTGGEQAREWAEAPGRVVRAWAIDQGLDVSTTGPIPQEVRAAYAAAHSD